MLDMTTEEIAKMHNNLPSVIEKLSEREGFSILIKGFYSYMKNTNTLPATLHNVQDNDFEDIEKTKFIATEVFRQMYVIATTD